MNEIIAVAGILRRGNTVLATERPAGKIMAGYWEFPGGKIEAGESPLEALSRELEEELGITVAAAEFWRTVTHTYAHGTVVLHIFFVTAFSGEPASMERQQIRWVVPSSAPELNFLPVDLPIMRELAGSV